MRYKGSDPYYTIIVVIYRYHIHNIFNWFDFIFTFLRIIVRKTIPSLVNVPKHTKRENLGFAWDS